MITKSVGDIVVLYPIITIFFPKMSSFEKSPSKVFIYISTPIPLFMALFDPFLRSKGFF